MHGRCPRRWSYIFLLTILAAIASPRRLPAQSSATSSSSSKHSKKSDSITSSGLDAGTLANGLYRNKALGFTCKIPAGWVLRTDEMEAQEKEAAPAQIGNDAQGTNSGSAPPERSRPGLDRTAEGGCHHMCSKVLLAAFSRPPEANGEDVNSSILIVAESAAAYPGLTAASQYFGPLTEVAKAQGFTIDEEPYEMDIGTATLVRGDFHKDVGTRRMLQSTLAFLAHGYAVSITLIGGTGDDVEELIDGLSFSASGK
jgi:hypothetical protein